MPEVKIKVCIICRESLPVTLEYFYKKKRGKWGLDTCCKSCMKKIMNASKDKEEKFVDKIDLEAGCLMDIQRLRGLATREEIIA